MKIYHVPYTRSVRIIWLAHELDLPLHIEPLDFSASYRATPEWRAKSPTGKVPVFEDDNIVIYESGAMVDYLLARYGNGALQPPAQDYKAYALYRQWCWFTEATFARPLGDMVQHTLIKPEAERLPAVVEDGRYKATACLDAYEGALGESQYLLGATFTAADIMTGYSLLLASRIGLDFSKHPLTQQYFDHLQQREGCKAAFNA